MSDAATLPTIDSLEEARELLAAKDHTIERLECEAKLLRQKLEALIARHFGGKKNEAVDPAQLELLLKGLEAARTLPPKDEPATPPACAPSKRKPRRQKLPDHLETEEIVLEPEEVKAQPDAWRKIGEERTEELDWLPAKFLRRLYIRPKYVRGERIVIAPLPARLIEQGLPGPGLLTQVVLGKYEDHLPLYRQAKIFRERHGVELARQTLADWIEHAAAWLRPVYEEIKRNLLGGGYLQIDETPIKYLSSDQKGRSAQGYLWTYGRPGSDVIFDWQTSRGRAGPEAFLRDYEGKLQSDGYGVYEALCRDRPNRELFGCWAHARRKFYEAREEDRRAAWFLRQIGMLYEIEAGLRKRNAGPDLREPTRQWQAAPVLRRLDRAMKLIAPKTLPQSRLGQALRYARDQWPLLEKYVAHGEVAIDNNLIENAIRPTALGKNYAKVSVMRSSATSGRVRGLFSRGGHGNWEFSVSA